MPLVRQSEQGDFLTPCFSSVSSAPWSLPMSLLTPEGTGQRRKRWRKEKFKSGCLINTFTNSLIRKKFGDNPYTSFIYITHGPI